MLNLYISIYLTFIGYVYFTKLAIYKYFSRVSHLIRRFHCSILPPFSTHHKSLLLPLCFIAFCLQFVSKTSSLCSFLAGISFTKQLFLWNKTYSEFLHPRLESYTAVWHPSVSESPCTINAENVRVQR